MVYFIIIVFAYIVYKLYAHIYFNSKKFEKVGIKFSSYAEICNLLNDHIEELKCYDLLTKVNYGEAELKDESRYNYKRIEQVKARKTDFIYDCSSSICKSAETQPFKYLCKYFNIDINEESLEYFEKKLNDFSIVEEGKYYLLKQLEVLKKDMKKEIPFLIRIFSMDKAMLKTGFKSVNISDIYFPTYTFRYISPGGNKTTKCVIKLDIPNLDIFVDYLNGLVKFKNSRQGQRALMNSELRNKIKQRDNYTCQHCGISTYDEPHLLLEIDHIIPIAKGGLTTESNLQVLCWKCNRSKGIK